MANESDTEDSEQHRIRQAEKSNQAGTRDEIDDESTSPKPKKVATKIAIGCGCLTLILLAVAITSLFEFLDMMSS